MAKYLNDFMYEQRRSNLSIQIGLIIRSAKLINKGIASLPGYEKLGKTAKEGLVFGIMQNIAALEDASDESELQRLFSLFMDLQEFSPTALSEGVTRKPKVISRLKAAAKTFKVR